MTPEELDNLFRLESASLRPNEAFVRKVMDSLPEKEAFSWRELWKIPAMGLVLASFLVLMFIPFREKEALDWAFLEGGDEFKAWIDKEGRPSADDLLAFALEMGGI